MLKPLFWEDTGDFDTDFANAVKWARNLLSMNPGDWVILDTETTGLPHESPEIVQIGILSGDGTVI